MKKVIYSIALIALGAAAYPLYMRFVEYLNHQDYPAGTSFGPSNNNVQSLQKPQNTMQEDPTIAVHLEQARRYAQQGPEYQPDKAMQEFKAILAINPNHVQANLELGDFLFHQGRLEEAFNVYQKLATIIPQAAMAYIAMGQMKEHQNQVQEAITYYKKALQLEPTNARAHIFLGGAYMALGIYPQAWDEYEWRWQVSNMPNLQGKWHGENLKGKTLVLLSENGLGDVIQFVRFVRPIKKMGVTIILQSPKALEKLFGLTDYIDHIVLAGSKTPAYDAITSIQSLAAHLRTTLDTIPAAPYLKADADLVKHWRQELSHDKNFKVGLCWKSGGEQMPIIHMMRSLPLKKLAPLAKIPDVSFYSLQCGEGVKQLQEVADTFHVIDFGPDFDKKHGGFMDTAAVMKVLDLVITIDTSVAHLAGALAVPTWIMLPFNPDPRWMLERSDTPWYPTAKLFRQPKPGDWDGMIVKIADALEKLVKTKKTT